MSEKLDDLQTLLKKTGATDINVIEKTEEDIKKGESLSYLLGNLDIFPKMTVSMIKIGEL